MNSSYSSHVINSYLSMPAPMAEAISSKIKINNHNFDMIYESIAASGSILMGNDINVTITI